LNKRRFYLIDTPGFDDSGHDGTTLTDHEVMRMIAAELTVFYEAGRLLSGLLFMHDISQARLGGSSVQV
jgi:hypothetical protein